MARYFGGNTLASFARNSTTIGENTTAGRFNAAYTDRSILVPTGTEISTPPFTASGLVWFRWDWIAGATNQGSVTMARAMNGTQNLFELGFNTGNNQYTFRVWTGSAWSTTVNLSLNNTQVTTLSTYAVEYDFANKTVRLYRDGSVLYENTAVGAGMVNSVTSFVLGGNQSSTGTFYSQVMIADYNILNSNLANLNLTGNSVVNTGQASGSYTDVNEVGRDDTTFVSITTVGNKAGFTKNNVSVPIGKGISAMVISAMARVNGTVTNGKVGIRSNGVNYSSVSLNFSSGHSPRQSIVDNNPATSTPFTATSFNAAEVYLEAA